MASLKKPKPKFRPVELLKEGIFVCGLAHSPRGIAETIVQAQAVASQVVCLLDQGGVKPALVISTVNERRCSGCERCIKACPYQARIKDTEKGIAKVIEHICQGCGVCVAVCPNQAAGLSGFHSKQIFSMIDAAFQELPAGGI